MPAVGIDTPKGTMDAWLARPDADEPRPGVLVVHDALGMTADLRRQAEWLADAGFVTLAPDLYHWGGRLRCVVGTVRDIARGRGRAFDDLALARDWLADRPYCTGRIGVIGYCLGGGFALLLATMGDYDAASVNYGALLGDAEDMAESCPLVGSYGGRDRSMDDTPQELERVLTAHGVPHDIEVYPDAGHGFLNDHDPDDMPAWVRIPGRYANTAFHEPSAIDARRRIEAFLHAHLDPA